MLRLISALMLIASSAHAAQATSAEFENLRSQLQHEADVAPDYVVAIDATVVIAVERLAQGSGEAGVQTLKVRGQERGAPKPRSWESQVQANCDAGLLRRIWGVTFEGPRRTGAAKRDDIPGAWERPQPGAAEQVFQSICNPAFIWPLRPTPEVSRASAGFTGTVAPPTQQVGAEAHRSTTETEPPGLPADGTGVSVQVGAALSEGQALDWARSALAKLGDQTGLAVRSQPTKVSGRTLHRALLAGFPDEPSAQAACSALKSAGAPCLVRVSPRAKLPRPARSSAPPLSDLKGRIR